ncbi:MAG TPA: phosphoribosyltransferase family protein, partial [Thermoanaerobaculia bacterium]|nr:phosphoribosyltransferase family protein [Thermoanaerobaculia bacterium]
RRLAQELGDEDPLLVGLLGGSLIFLADLVRAVERPVRFELIHVGYSSAPDVPAETPAGTATEEGTEEGFADGVLGIHYPLPVEIAGQSVVVVKDVVSSGVTEPYLAQQLRDHGAREVRFAALIDLPDERKTEFELDYSVFQLRHPRASRDARDAGGRGLLVGYGLKHEGRFGNLPFVGLLPEGA